MTHRDYYLKGRNDRVLQIYRRFALKVAESFGADESRAERDVENLIDFEIDLANVSTLILLTSPSETLRLFWSWRYTTDFVCLVPVELNLAYFRHW